MSYNDGRGGNGGKGPKINYTVTTSDTYGIDDSAVKNDLTLSAKAVGSIAGRAQAWERSTSTAGYVTIGSIRYGVRFSSSKDVVPSRGSALKHPDESDCCCGVVHLAWPRAGASPLPPSRIPLPNSEKSQAINKSEERAAPVYRSALEVSRSKKAPVGCFAIDSDESSQGDMKATPPTPNSLRRRGFVKPGFKFGTSAASSSSDGETSRLISSADSKDDLSNENGTSSQFQNTLDKLQKFRFGGSSSEDKTNGNHKKKRSSDKTERLRELTDKLLHSRNPTSPDRKKPPICSSSPPSKFSNKHHSTGSSLRNLFGSTTSLAKESNDGVNVNSKRASSAPSAEKNENTKKSNCQVKSAQTENLDDDDKFECDDVRLRKAESRPIVGSYTQRTIVPRSASFSQVDYDTADGKYTRTSRGNDDNHRNKLPSTGAIGSMTFPRVKQVDASTSVSPPPDKLTEEITSSTPSVDSAVGSDEGFVLGSSNNLILMSEPHKPSGSRSLTYPFTKKTSKSDEMPFSSIDGNGLKSLQQSPSLTRELSDVKEEYSGSSETPTITDTLSESSNETVKEKELLQFDVINETGDSSENGNSILSENDDKTAKTIYQCTVKEYPVQLEIPEYPEKYLIELDESATNTEQNRMTTLETLEKEINELITQQNNAAPMSTSPGSSKPKIYVTTWPKDQEKRLKLKLRCDTNWKDEKQNHKNSEKSNRWSGDMSGSEPISPEDNSPPKTKEPLKLQTQSSDEQRDERSKGYHLLTRTDSLSEGESDHGERRPSTPLRDRDGTSSPSPIFSPVFDLSDGENNKTDKRPPKRYWKRPLRGPYGQMLEAEMKKPETTRMLSKKQFNEDLKFLEDYVPTPLPAASATDSRPSSESRLSSPRPRANTARSFDDSQLHNVYNSSTNPRNSPKRKVSANIPFSAPNPPTSKDNVLVCHQRTTSSPSQLEGFSTDITSSPSPSPVSRRNAATQELLAELLNGSSVRRFLTEDSAVIGNSLQYSKDTRTHVIVELFETERSYVESLQIIVQKYLQPLKSPENSGLVDISVVDEIFYQIPAILVHHEILLDELRKRLDHWDIRQKVGDIFLDVFTKQSVIETYTSFINNWKTAKEAIRTTCQQKQAFARFLEAMAREHKGKLALDSLIIMPVQRIPRYELLIQRLLKHTEPSHPDHALLLAAQHEVHELAVKINLTERETLESEQQQQTLRDLEALIEGLVDLTATDRTFIRHDTVTMATDQGTRKERALFLFSDLLIITSIKRRSGTIRKPSTSCPGGVASTLDANKYKLMMRIPIDDLEIVKTKDENLKRMMREMEKLTEDAATLTQINELTSTLHCPHNSLEEIVKEMLANVNKQLSDRQNSDSQLSYLELMLNTQNGIKNISVVFTKPDKRASWEESFNESKQKLALSADRRPSPEFVAPVPIRKTRAGLQFTCAAPTLGLNALNLRDVWVCNSDGYVGQVCVLSLQPEPTVTSCNGVCNARILCVASIPAGITPGSRDEKYNEIKPDISISVEDTDDVGGNIELVSSSSSEEDDDNETQPDDSEARRSKSEPITNDVGLEETDNQQPTMWLGTEDGNIHVYNCSDNIRIKKNKVKIQHGSSVFCIIYLDNRVFVSLANGDITVYIRDHIGGWNTSDPYTVSVGTAATPVTKMIPVAGRLWCGCHNTIKILNTSSLHVEHSFQVNADASRAVTGMAVYGSGVWISLQNSAIIRLFHSTTYENLCDVNVAPAVTKMLAGCDDIIRQHKAACLRVTTLLACKDLLWIGTSAGVVLTMPLPHVTQSTSKLTNVPGVTGVPHGHTGHVRFLTCVETTPPNHTEVRPSAHHRYSLKSKDLQTPTNAAKMLVISGGDGYEDFRNSSMSEVAGREDSTNHLLLWHI